jgi:hypothetical protein
LYIFVQSILKFGWVRIHISRLKVDRGEKNYIKKSGTAALLAALSIQFREKKTKQKNKKKTELP